LIQTKEPDLLAKMVGIVKAADANEPRWRTWQSSFNPRVIEFHTYLEGGGLTKKRHYDEGSCFTIIMMLSATDEFEGGKFKTWEADEKWCIHDLCQGDCLVIPSHKYHSVDSVTAGKRNVVVMEIWDGPEGCGDERIMPPGGGKNHGGDDFLRQVLPVGATVENAVPVAPGLKAMTVPIQQDDEKVDPTEAAANLDSAAECKEEGSSAFRDGKWQEACDKYEQAIKILRVLSKKAIQASSVEEKRSLTERINQLTLSSSLNAAVCYGKLGRWDYVVGRASAALEVMPSNFKASFYRGKGLVRTSRYAEARKQLLHAARLEPQNKQVREELRIATEAVAKAATQKLAAERLAVEKREKLVEEREKAVEERENDAKRKGGATDKKDLVKKDPVKKEGRASEAGTSEAGSEAGRAPNDRSCDSGSRVSGNTANAGDAGNATGKSNNNNSTTSTSTNSSGNRSSNSTSKGENDSEGGGALPERWKQPGSRGEPLPVPTRRDGKDVSHSGRVGTAEVRGGDVGSRLDVTFIQVQAEIFDELRRGGGQIPQESSIVELEDAGEEEEEGEEEGEVPPDWGAYLMAAEAAAKGGEGGTNDRKQTTQKQRPKPRRHHHLLYGSVDFLALATAIEKIRRWYGEVGR
jgi:tetratricopeptide (TPR) repeat protein